ncbi:MAG: hypothetical protein SFU84_02510 [Gemmatimonadales bacterium]|nr:hypothetical protein [Gemmatimonadales bacterium]
MLDLSQPSLALSIGLCALALLAALAVYVAYLGRLSAEVAELVPTRRYLLAGLRVLALLLLVLLVLRPLMVRLTHVNQPPQVAVLIDDSQSLSQAGDTTYYQRQLNEDLARLQSRLSAAGAEVRRFRFGEQLITDSTDARGRARQTDLAAALRQTTRSLSPRAHVATVVISDGIVTKGGDPRFEPTLDVAPVYSVLLGDSLPRRDLRLHPPQYNDVATLGVATPIRVEVSAEAAGNAPVRLRLRRGAQMLAEKVVTLGGVSAQVEFSYTPERAGVQLLRLEALPMAGERNLRNNGTSLSLRVIDQRSRMLLLAERPHPDLAALRQAIATDRRFDVRQRVRALGTESTAWPSTLFDSVSAVILHGLPVEPAASAELGQILRRRGLPFALVLTPSTPPAALASWTDLLPIAMGEPPADLPRQAQPQLTEAGRRHATYTFGADYDRWLQASPPLDGPDVAWRIGPTAEVLALARVQGVSLESPLIVAGQQAQQRQLVVLGQGLWRQRVEAFVQTGSTALFDQWWQNVAGWLAAARDVRRFRVTPALPAFDAEQPVVLNGRLLDERNAGLDDAQISLRLTEPSGSTRSLRLASTGGGTYRVELLDVVEGEYSYTAQAERAGRVVGTDRGQFAVRATAAEFQRLRADPELMRQLALRSGGRFYPAPTLEAVGEAIAAQPNLLPVVSERSLTEPILHSAWMLTLILILLCAEWLLRKAWGQL